LESSNKVWKLCILPGMLSEVKNYGTATGKEVLDLSQKIQEEVLTKFGIRITPEVNIID
jgi:hypothetical protein